MKRTDAERSHLETLDAFQTERPFDFGRCSGAPAGEQQEHPVFAEPSQCKYERAGRGGVEPLEIVDRNEYGSVFGEPLQGGAGGGRECSWIKRVRRLLLEEKCHFERAPLWKSQRREDVV
jgi:hypothetical protein